LPRVRHTNPRTLERCLYRTTHRLSHPIAPREVSDAMMRDLLGRPLKNLRLSVTDRCNLRCSYCMPEAEYVWLPRQDILQFEEIDRLLDAFLDLGIDKVRL